MGNKQRGNWRTFWGLASTAIFLIPGAGTTAFVLKSLAVGATNILINAMLPMLPGKEVDSPAYSWKHEANLPANADIPMPIVYGKTRVKGVIKSRHVRLDGTKQYLDVMYSFTGHRVDERTVSEWSSMRPYFINNEVKISTYPGRTYICIRSHVNSQNPLTENSRYWKLGHGTAYNAGISDITIDNNPIESYVTATPDIFTFETRAGAAQQSFIAGFETSYDNYPQGTVINIPQPRLNPAQAIIKKQRIDNTNYTWLRHSLLFLGSTYDIEEDTQSYGLYPMYVRWSLDEPTKYTLSNVLPTTGSGYWLIATFNNFSTFYGTIPPVTPDWTHPNVVLSNIHDIELVFDFPQGLYSMDWINGKTITSSAVIYAQYREIGTTQWFDFQQIPKWDDGAINVSYASNMHVTANTPNNFSVSWSAVAKDAYLDPAKNYEVQVYADCSSPIELANVAGVTYSLPDGDGEYRPHTYPGECLLGIRALATGYLQGGFEVTAVIERSIVQVMDDTGTWADKAANCHAWAVYDILVNGWASHPEYPNMINSAALIQPVYGCGIDPDRIDYDSFLDWESHTYTTIAFRLNTVFDTTMTIWDAISRICEEGMASLIPIGSEFRALVDREATTAEINSLFCMGNINEGTFHQSWVDASKKARSIEVHFADADRTPAYDQTTFTVRIPEWDTADEQDSPLSMTLYGTTDYIQALAIAQYRLNCNYYLSQMCSFETDVEAMELEVGDVIPIQHDTMCGAGGRLADVVYNLILNPSFEDATVSPWLTWGTPALNGRSADQQKYGSYSLHTRSSSEVYPTAHNQGRQQTFTVKSNTTYTLSCWIYMLNVYTSTATIRAMTLVTGSPYTILYADKTVLNQWQFVSTSFTTAAGQTEATVWLGGIGEAYFDGVMVSPGTTIPTFMLNGLMTLTLDKAMTTVPLPTEYELQIACKDGGIETKRGITSGNMSADGTVITFGAGWAWTYYPEIYDPYAFGELDNVVKKFRIMSLTMNSDFKFEITAMEYDAETYDLDNSGSQFTLAKMALVAPDLNLPVTNVFNRALTVTLQEVVSLNRTTGQYESSIVVKFTPPQGELNGEWEVSWRDVDADEGQVEGVWDTGDIYDVNAIVEKDGVVYISNSNGNTSEPYLLI